MYCVLKGRAGGSRWEVGGRIDLVSCRKVIYGISGYMAPLYPETKGEGLVCVCGGGALELGLHIKTIFILV